MRFSSISAIIKRSVNKRKRGELPCRKHRFMPITRPDFWNNCRKQNSSFRSLHHRILKSIRFRLQRPALPCVPPIRKVPFCAMKQVWARATRPCWSSIKSGWRDTAGFCWSFPMPTCCTSGRKCWSDSIPSHMWC